MGLTDSKTDVKYIPWDYETNAVPISTPVIVSYFMVWSIDVASHRNVRTFPVKLPNGEIQVIAKPHQLLSTPGSTPMMCLSLGLLNRRSVIRAPAGKVQVDSRYAICDFDGNANIVRVIHRGIAEIYDESFDMRIIVGDEFDKLAKQYYNFICSVPR